VQPFRRILKAAGCGDFKKGAHRFDIHFGIHSG
jgi:hypothetical protein